MKYTSNNFFKKKELTEKYFAADWKTNNLQPTPQKPKEIKSKFKMKQHIHRHTQWFCSFGNKKRRLAKRVPQAPYHVSGSGNYYLLTKKMYKKQVPISSRCDLSLCMLSHSLEANGLEISWSEDEELDKYQIHTMAFSYSLFCWHFIHSYAIISR